MDLYRRALKAEPRLRTIETMVNTQILYLRRGDTFCSGCYWDLVLKPLVSPLVGWCRGYPPKQADDPDPEAPAFKLVNLGELMERRDRRPAPETETEEWLRTSEAFDVVTDRLLAKLDAADPAHGHGFKRAGRAS